MHGWSSVLHTCSSKTELCIDLRLWLIQSDPSWTWLLTWGAYYNIYLTTKLAIHRIIYFFEIQVGDQFTRCIHRQRLCYVHNVHVILWGCIQHATPLLSGGVIILWLLVLHTSIYNVYEYWIGWFQVYGALQMWIIFTTNFTWLF